MSLAAARLWIRRSTLGIYRVLTWGLLAAGFIFAAVVMGLRYWVLPDIESHRGRIAEAVSGLVQQKVTIGAISANWDHLRPQLSLSAVIVHDAQGRPALELPQVDATLSWRSAALLQINFHSLDIHRPALTVRRDSKGRYTVAGIPIDMEAKSGGGLSRWLLSQRDIEIHGAQLSWHDELRAAPVLKLEQLQLRIVNSGDRHRVALRALPPAALSAPLDVRADLRGDDFQAIADKLTGQLYVHVEHVDIAAWRQWIDFPVHFPHGTGAMRAWFNFARNELTGVIADTQLSGVRARLGAQLPELDMPQLGGRFAWQRAGDGFQFSTRKLTFSTGDGLRLPPVDLTLKLGAADREGFGRGEMQANALELAPLVQLADRLPLSADFRKSLTGFSPEGSVYDLAVRWNGHWPDPAAYAVRGRVHGLSLKNQGRIPGFSGFSGNIDATEKGGTLHMSSQRVSIEMPRLFRERLLFDTLTGQLGWSKIAQGFEWRLANFNFANADLAGNLFGSYRTAHEGPGIADFTGNLTRAAAQRVSAYLPLTISAGSRAWLDRAFTAGSSSDVRFRVKGDLGKFPWADDRGGIFEVVARVNGGALIYGEGWPSITAIEGDLLFRGKRMEVNARQGTISNTRLSKVRAVIPDLVYTDEVLQISGEAEGSSLDFLDYIAKSPVRSMIGGFTDDMQAQGRGRLVLRLTLPLRAMSKSRLTGSYQFINNQLVPEPGFPPLEQVNGRIEFTESVVRVPGATAMFLGGPLSVSAGSQRDAAVNIQFQGRVNSDAARRAGGPQWLRHVRGSTDWRGTLVMRNRRVDLAVESSLQGLAINLPAPFTKPAAESLPLKVERRHTGPGQERIALSAGNLVHAVLQRRGEGAGARLERGTVRFGEQAAAQPDRPGLSITGAIKTLDLDGWLALLSEPGAGVGAPLAVVDLNIGELEVFDRRFGALALSAQQQSGALQAVIKGRDVDGVATWRPQGKGHLTARLRRLSLPARDEVPVTQAAASTASTLETKPSDSKTTELPALDVVIDEFQLAERALGKLELQATAQNLDWRIERLRLSNPESTLNLDGVWQTWLTRPLTQVNVRLDVSDAGKFLTRMGYPEGVRRGVAKIEGNLSWAGSPQRIDYPTLSGNFVMDAGKGQFVKLEPGIGKLLGILSLQSLPRRISLDFRDIFSEGLAFDEIVGAVKVVKGVASTDNLRIIGPAARINMAGQVDLGRETQQLRVKVNPQISDSVSVAGALIGGPIAGLAAFVAQKLLKDPLNEIAAYEYDVTGTWADPVVTKVERAVPAAANAPGSTPGGTP